MGGNIRLVKLFGIPVELNVSWFLIFFLVSWSLSAQVFPAWAPGFAPFTYWSMGLATALVLFASLLLHELAHSLMSRRFGQEVRRITLFLFGGVSEAPGEMPSAKAEFWIAVVGPLTSFALAAIFFAAGAAAGALDAPVWLSSALSWLAVINFALAVFNLIPGFPLDGGRIFRAAVWAKTKDMRKATRWASNGGKAFAVVLIGIGLARLFGGNWFGGFWLLFLGWLLFQAAAGTYQQLVVRQALNKVSVGALMSRDLVTLSPEARLREVVEHQFMRLPYGSYPVLEGDRLVGLLGRKQVKDLPAERWDAMRVAEAMAPAESLTLLRPDQPVGEVVEALTQGGIGRLPVVENGRLVGLLSQSDVMRYLSWQGEGKGEGYFG